VGSRAEGAGKGKNRKTNTVSSLFASIRTCMKHIIQKLKERGRLLAMKKKTRTNTNQNRTIKKPGIPNSLLSATVILHD